MIAGVDWGSVPEWVGVILTGAALIIGALVFRRERADRVSETARRVFVTYQEDQTLLVRNDGQTPVEQINVHLAELVLDAMPGRTVAFLSISNLQPGEHQVHEPTLDPGEHLPRITAFALDWQFVDGDGRAWHRDWTGKLARS